MPVYLKIKHLSYPYCSLSPTIVSPLEVPIDPGLEKWVKFKRNIGYPGEDPVYCLAIILNVGNLISSPVYTSLLPSL